MSNCSMLLNSPVTVALKQNKKISHSQFNEAKCMEPHDRSVSLRRSEPTRFKNIIKLAQLMSGWLS